MEAQAEFLYADGVDPKLAPPDPRENFYREVAAVWSLPLGERVRVALHHHDLPEVSGRLELAGAPDLPLNAHEPLRLQIGQITFLSPQIQNWTLLA
jgi:hypothetical protein